MTGGTNATKFKIRCAYQIGGESFHGQVTSVTPRCLTIRQENTCATYSHRVWEGKRESTTFLQEDTIIASVLP